MRAPFQEGDFPGPVKLPGRAEVVAAIGAGFALPADAVGECDLVVHASASSSGLQLSLDLLCARPRVMDCQFENMCECTFFQTSIEFRPTLLAQRQDACQGQVRRAEIFDQLITGLGATEAS